MKNSELTKHIGQTILKYRLIKKITQPELADLLNLTRASICNIEAGRQGTNISTLYLIIALLNIPITEIFVQPEPLSFDTFIEEVEVTKTVKVRRTRIITAKEGETK